MNFRNWNDVGNFPGVREFTAMKVGVASVIRKKSSSLCLFFPRYYYNTFICSVSYITFVQYCHFSSFSAKSSRIFSL